MNENSRQDLKTAKSIIKNYISEKNECIIIHYARQNFINDAYEKGPRVIAITVMNAQSQQIRNFSLKRSSNNSFYDVSEAEQDKIEYLMLKDFFDYVDHNKEKKWFHWNMENNDFGFQAIEDRYKSLGGEPIHFNDKKTINISSLLEKRYGINFAKDSIWNGHHTGKMYDIFTMNKIKDEKILNGDQEIKEYILKNITVIEQSVLEKVKSFHRILEMVANRTLKVRGNVLKDVYGLTLEGIADYISDNKVLALLFSIIGGIISSAIWKMIE